MQDMKTSLLMATIGGGYSDIDFLISKISEYKLDIDDIVDYAKELNYQININSLIYATFYIAGNNFLDKVEKYANDMNIKFNRYAIDVEPFVNYLDSFLNGVVLNSDIDIMDYSDNNLSLFINKVNNR